MKINAIMCIGMGAALIMYANMKVALGLLMVAVGGIVYILSLFSVFSKTDEFEGDL
jgi:hypothetical protein